MTMMIMMTAMTVRLSRMQVVEEAVMRIKLEDYAADT